MKKRLMLLASALLCISSGFAQRTPTHALDIKDANFDNLVDFFADWKAGTRPPGVTEIDDQFYISRVRPAERITDGDYTAVPDVDPERKMCLWVPLDDPTSKWKALPRYCFEGDNFSLWSYVNIHGNWTSPWFRATAGLTDVAHKNGVKVGCVYSIAWAASVILNGTNTPSKVFTLLTKKSNGQYLYSEQFVKLLKYYGIDGIGVNSEFSSNYNTMNQFIGFIKECHKKAKEIGWEFQLHWYDGTNSNGAITFDQGLGSHNKNMFGTGEDIVTDMMFANYNWTNTTLFNSVANAEDWGRSSYDYYAGFDIQGRALQNSNWSALDANKISIGFWGAHSQSLIHQSATDDGTSDVAIQKAYLQKQEMIFSGGNRNPANQPALNTTCNLGNGSLKNFHGLARFLSAKSTIQNVPFVSRFNLGNGLKFYDEGQVKFNHKWHNIATQDIMPTWRWWIVNGNESAKEGGLVQADLTWDDAYFGGSCLSLHGATTLSRVKLFKTKLAVQPSYTFSITYKLNNELATHAKLFVALQGALTTYKEIDIPAAPKYGEWTTFTATAEQLGLKAGDVVSMIGITVADAPADYLMYIGEMAVRNPSQTFAPVTPTVKNYEICRGKGASVDFKLQYESKSQVGLETPTYNDEVDTWYFEIFMQQKDQEQQLLTATTSWAAYVVDAPLVSGFEGRQARFGVRAVSPDGVKKSDIAWTEYIDIPYDAPSNDVVLDREVIKPGETFKAYLEDAMADAAQSWTVINAKTGATVYTASNATSITTSLSDIGAYDLVLVDSKGESTTYRGKIHVTPEATGSVPAINSFSVNKSKANAGDEVTYNYDYRAGEGSVSRAIAIKDPDMLMIPGEVQTGKTYTYALWVKADTYAHDKQGTNLISKNTVADKWPHNNWGDLWVQIRPEWTGNATHAANEVSFNTMGWTAHDNPNEEMMSTGYQLNPGVWNHIAVTQDASNNQQMFFNGKRVASCTFSSSTRREDYAASDSRIDATTIANIFIGGGGVYKAGFNGWIDEVQVWNKALTEDEVVASMNGYDTNSIPDGLQGYYTFESFNKTDSTFANYGKAGSQYPAYMVRTDGSGGENTSNAAYVKQGADNEVTGYPGVTGSLEVKSTRTLGLKGARISSETDKAAVVTYANNGTYDATLTVTNVWGEDTKTLEECIEIEGGQSAIDGVEADAQFAIYPNPFVESVNFRFAEGGNYVINMLTADGSLVQRNAVEAAAGSVVNVAVTGNAGLYLIQVVKDGKTYKTVKVVKR